MFVGNFLVGASVIQPLQIRVGRVFDPFGLGQGAQVGLPIRARVLAHDALHRGVGFQGRRVDPQRAAPEQSLLVQQPEHELEDPVENVGGQALADDAQGGVDRRGFGQWDAQEAAQRQAMPRWLSIPSK